MNGERLTQIQGRHDEGFYSKVATRDICELLQHIDDYKASVADIMLGLDRASSHLGLEDVPRTLAAEQIWATILEFPARECVVE